MTNSTTTKSNTPSKSLNSSAGNRQSTSSTKKGGRGYGGGKGGNTSYRKKTGTKPDNNNNNTNNKNAFRGQLQSGVLKNVVISENTNKRPMQFRKMYIALPTFCAEQKFSGLDEIVRKMEDWDESTFYTERPSVTEWAEEMNVKVADDENGKPIMRKRMVVVDPEKKEELLEKWSETRKHETKKLNKCQDDKKSLVTFIRGQLDEGTTNELELSPEYEKALKDGDVVKIISNLRTICYGNDDGGLSYRPYKAVIAAKGLTTYVTSNPADPHGFKDELRTRYNAALALTGKFPNGTVFMEQALADNVADDGSGNIVATPLTIENYFTMTAEKREYWEKKGDELNIAMLFCNNSRNEPMKKDLRIAYSQGSKHCYPKDVESMARLQATQYSIRRSNAPPAGGGPLASAAGPRSPLSPSRGLDELAACGTLRTPD